MPFLKIWTICVSLGAALISLNSPAFGQEIDEVIVTAVRDTSVLRTEDSLVAPPDTAALLSKMPGASVNKNGELTGIAQYRGMYGDRLNISVNGNNISSGGPNAMDAPLHYAPVALMESLTVHRGIVPVSAGQETIGGQIEARSFLGEHSSSQDFDLSSRIYTGLQSVNEGLVGSAQITLANNQHLLRGSLMREEGEDSDFAEGSITPSSYERNRADLGYSFKQGDHLLSIDLARNETGDAGTAALPMDILSVDSDLVHAQYQWQGEGRTLTTQVSHNEIEHWMTNFHLRRPPQDNAMTAGTMRYRQTFAVGENDSFLVEFEQQIDAGLWRIGVDGHYADHEATITNPNAGMFYVDNFNEVSRNIIGLYAETELNLSSSLGLETGIRMNQVEMDAGVVGSNLNPMGVAMGMPVMMANMASALASSFNTSDLQQSDSNLDLFMRLSLSTGSDLIWYAGAARKTRSPSYQERYLWMPMEATGGLADGLTYVGNTSLKPEVAHEVELGFDWDGQDKYIYPRVFYKKVSDYIQGAPTTNNQVIMLSQMMANMGMGTGTTLQFSNVEASFYGVDLESGLNLASNFSLRAVLSAVRAQREDIDDDLYRIAPDNLLLALDYTANRWMASLEAVAYAKQDRVSTTNNEQQTAGYLVLNASTSFYLQENLEVGVGIDNLLDKNYQDHLAGYNRAFNTDVAMRDRLPGLGRNIYGRLIWRL